MKNLIKDNYKLDISQIENLESKKPDLIILFCLEEFELNESKIKKIDKKFHTFIHWYNEKFKKIYENASDFNNFLKSKNSKDNNSILYTGIEKKIQEKYNKKISKYKNEYESTFLTKIIIKGERGSRLLSLIGYKLKNENKTTIDKIIFHIYPILIDNFHEK